MAKQKIVTNANVWKDDGIKVVYGRIARKGKGNISRSNLFKCIGEKLPMTSLDEVCEHLKKELGKKKRTSLQGVYMAHDSFGVARYGGRGQIFVRLSSHRKKYDSLIYYSFYIIEKKANEHEVETALLRAAESQMLLNKRKVRQGSKPGSVYDYRIGTRFFQRQKVRGRRKGRK
jgi:hypothetical protein